MNCNRQRRTKQSTEPGYQSRRDSELVLSALPGARRSADNSAAPSAEDLAYYRAELARIARIARPKRELGAPSRLLEMGVDALERRLEAMGGAR